MTAPEGVTDDAALGGRLRLLQPKRGHRFGHDAVLLAAATSAGAGDHVVEFGAGVGLAGLALARRVPGARVTLVEIDQTLCALAGQNAERNDLAGRIAVLHGDVTQAAMPAATHVMMNPPYNDPQRHRASPHAGRASAHMAADGLLQAWCDAAARVLTQNGTLTLIWRADGLDAVHAALTSAFGDTRVLPVETRPGVATLVLVSARKGAAPSRKMLPPLRLNGPDGKPTAESERVVRDAAALAL
ncbi:N5-glutamine S-adenosyl-L-methionine-dependent methyltransferase [Variibacter gotjawalensis]|uniref:N5-glutamine S-adenosyl-L-methionine-dependent methyltransferase n=1 Tax=Variibacter gotjawalensis TaxID=1333996 RepID=A0A0S3PT33_9BRAD|nr:methyltransferase [Variibacter gotjawalensis]NIK49373.1 tRNA1(Val) A37 N6-methylase TrmN6 [Variibacter gotjawalensis]RZS51224.1 tRNA1(Val) A37 N6-methylase TrmN6 [Variibacter gotjawalensis]BAT59058.1 N5-glutamine S-adenosyl-L-methionine-dependent methyltransferase [Variibacter gotjawalensis]